MRRPAEVSPDAKERRMDKLLLDAISEQGFIEVTKLPQKKDAIRINAHRDIPKFLSKTISVYGNVVTFFNRESETGIEKAPVGSIIGYEKYEQSPSGWNAWWIEDESLLNEINGEFYVKPVSLKVLPVSDKFPEFMRGADIVRSDDGTWTFNVYGGQIAHPGKDYWVQTGVDSKGTPQGYILGKDTPSYESLVLLNENGEIANLLCCLDPA